MLMRFATGILAGAVAVAAILLLESDWFLLLAILVLEVATLEYVRLGRRAGASRGLYALLVLVPALSALWIVESSVSPWVVLAVSPLAFSLYALAERSDPRSSLATLGWSSFGAVYLVLPTWSMFEIHSADPHLLLALLVSVWANDTVALLVGSKFGRRKMAPCISPNKTWEGSIAGLIGGLVVGVAGLELATGSVTPAAAVLFGVVAVASQAGDLVESSLKRAVGVKDAGSLLPGHGGMLDRLDAILVASPVFYALSVLIDL